MARTPEELPIQRARDEIRNAVRHANRLVVVAPTDAIFDKIASNFEQVRARGGRLVLLSDKAGVARLGAKANVKTLVISHVTEQIDQPGVREKVVREMAAIYPGNIVFGEDLLEVPVRGPTAAKLL